MKLIHLSDLHLGKRVNEFSMLEDQRYILREILGIIDEEISVFLGGAVSAEDCAARIQSRVSLWLAEHK